MLENVDIQALEPKDKPYKVGMGKSLYLLIKPNGSKYWRYKYRINGKENTMSFGVYPEVSVEEAIENRDFARKQLRNGLNPQKVRAAKRKLRDTSDKTFAVSVSLNGEVSITAGSQIITLNEQQTLALKAFMNAMP